MQRLSALFGFVSSVPTYTIYMYDNIIDIIYVVGNKKLNTAVIQHVCFTWMYNSF
jgi:hypothetical protein